MAAMAPLQRWQVMSKPSPPIPEGPRSDVCKMFTYTRYFIATNYSEFKELGKIAQPGDMIELLPGKYSPIYAHEERVNNKTGKCRWPRTATDGAIYALHGAPGKLITFCGTPGKTVIDGTPLQSSGAGILVVKSSYVRVAGFTVTNVLRGMDIQHTTNSEFLYITTSHTWHEGVRIRYHSSNNLLQYCNIQHTGKGYVGNGEGVYVGTASGQTVLCDNPKDETNYNIIRDNVFGPNVPSENVDVKEYTTGGQIINNTFDGKYMMGIHASISWVVLKGTNYTVANNTGYSLNVPGGGIRIVKRGPQQASYNTVTNNTCYGLIEDSFCVFVDPSTKGEYFGIGLAS
ncbi:hypothetical protein Ndes2526A_g03195 [Nannochloris sp. 'desiccata']